MSRCLYINNCSRLRWHLVLLLLQLLLLLRMGGLLLGAHKLRIVNEAVLVVVVHRQNGIDEGEQFLVGEDLLFDGRLGRIVIVIVLLLAALFCALPSSKVGGVECESDCW